MDCISKKVKVAVLITNTSKDRTFEHFTKIYRLIKEHGASVRVPDIYREYLSSEYDVEYLCEEELYCGADAAIVLGGDGTMLKAATGAVSHGTPILGVNLGRVGYMAEIGKDETELIGRLFEGRYSVSERMTLRVCVEEDGERRCVCEHALNDAVVRSSLVARVQGLRICSGGITVADHRGDGLIISTPTGSTAYSMSAGGPVLDPSLECLCLTPICSLSPAARSMVFSADSEITIENAHDNTMGMYLNCDGFDGIVLSERAKVIISRADIKAKLISMGGEEFFNVLRKKLTSAM